MCIPFIIGAKTSINSLPWIILVTDTSKIHRHKETVHATRWLCASVEYPIVAVLAWQHRLGGDYASISSLASQIIVSVLILMHLLRLQSVRIGGAAARGLNPIGDCLAVGPIVVRVRDSRPKHQRYDW